MSATSWEKIKDFYRETFGIPESLVELVASSDILLMCASGTSNENISKLLDVDEESVLEVIRTVFEFDGWREDLLLNPYSVFTELALDGKTLFKNFNQRVLATGSDSEDIKTMFRICRLFDKISWRIDREWV